jgi:chloride intracellular channel protein 6
MTEAVEAEGGTPGSQGPPEGPAFLAERPDEPGAVGPEAERQEANEGAAVSSPGAEGAGAEATATAVQEEGDGGPAPGAGSDPGADPRDDGVAQGEAEDKEVPQGGGEASGAVQVEETGPGRGAQGEAAGEAQGDAEDPAALEAQEDGEHGLEGPEVRVDALKPAPDSMEAEGLAERAEGAHQDEGDCGPQPQSGAIEVAAAETGRHYPGEFAGGTPGSEGSEGASPGEARADAGENGDRGGTPEGTEEEEEGRSKEAAAGEEEEPPDGSPDGEAAESRGAEEPQAELSNHLAEERSAEAGDGSAPVNGRREDGEVFEEGDPGQEHDITLFVKVNVAFPKF